LDGRNAFLIPWLAAHDPFPSLASALSEPNGLLAAGGDLSTQRLLEAYRGGIFPWFNPGDPILWWSPDPRMVLLPSEFKLSRSLRKTLKKRAYEIRVDTVFQAVTWISPEIITAYTQLHKLGIAHSIETWLDGKLVGGLYGLAIGRMFYGESMFSLATDASKIALAHLVQQLERWDFGMIDCQMNTAHLASLGAREIPRAEFIQRLGKLVNYPNRIQWQFDHELFA